MNFIGFSIVFEAAQVEFTLVFVGLRRPSHALNLAYIYIHETTPSATKRKKIALQARSERFLENVDFPLVFDGFRDSLHFRPFE